MTQPAAEIKKKLRGLKKLECKLRFGCAEFSGRRPALVFDEFFDLGGSGVKKARHTLGELSQMERPEFSSVIEEYLAEVYFRVYGFREGDDFQALSALALPFNADEREIKRRFRELAKKTHPDVGGDPEQFIKLKAQYDELVKKNSST